MSTVLAIEPKLEGQTMLGPKITSSIMYGSTSFSESYRVQVDTGVPFFNCSNGTEKFRSYDASCRYTKTVTKDCGMDYCIWVARSGYLRSWSNPFDNFKVHNSYRLATDKARQSVGIEGQTVGSKAPNLWRSCFGGISAGGRVKWFWFRCFESIWTKLGGNQVAYVLLLAATGNRGSHCGFCAWDDAPDAESEFLWKRQIWISHDRPTFSHYNHHLLGTFLVYSISFCIFLQFFRVKMPQVPRRDNQAQRLQDKEAKRARGLSSQWFL